MCRHSPLLPKGSHPPGHATVMKRSGSRSECTGWRRLRAFHHEGRQSLTKLIKGQNKMTQLPDVCCMISVINNADGKRLSDGSAIFGDGSATVRYLVVNDSNKPAGPFTVVGSLSRDGV